MLLTAALFVVMWSNEGIYPARYAEEQVKLATPLIEQADSVSKELIPELCRYVVFDEEGHILVPVLSLISHLFIHPIYTRFPIQF